MAGVLNAIRAREEVHGEEISWVESIWTYKLYQLFWLFKRQHGKCVLSNGL